MRRNKYLLLLIALLLPCCMTSAEEFEVRVVDAITKRPISVRMTIKNVRGAKIKQRGVPFYAGSFCFFGKHVFKLPRGPYTFVIEKGPEYYTRNGHFEVKRGANDGVTVELPRIRNLSDSGWWGADFQVHRPEKDIPLLLDANGLAFVNRISWDQNGVSESSLDVEQPARKKVTPTMVFDRFGGMQRKGQGGLIFAGGAGLQINQLLTEGQLVDFPNLKNEESSPLTIVQNPTAHDFPVWLAAHAESKFQIDAVAIPGDRFRMDGQWKKSTGTRKLSKTESSLPGKFETQVYFHALNCGFKIPPVGASGSGESGNEVGYNRAYVHCGPNFSAEKLMANVRLGRTIVTNGPIMEVRFNGVLPGETFHVASGEAIEIETTLTLALKEKANYLELIQNGLVTRKISLDEYAKAKGRLPKVEFKKSGWMLVRIATASQDAYRFVMSGPVYVDVGSKSILEKQSAEFFRDWMIEQAKAAGNRPAAQRDALIERLRPAYDYWRAKAE